MCLIKWGALGTAIKSPVDGPENLMISNDCLRCECFDVIGVGSCDTERIGGAPAPVPLFATLNDALSRFVTAGTEAGAPPGILQLPIHTVVHLHRK